MEISYKGNEIALFARARNWKRYLADMMQPYLSGCVLEVGAGLGSTTEALCRRPCSRWICLEPDQTLRKILRAAMEEGRLPECCEVAAGTLTDMPAAELFDTVLYVDVLEHIEEDRAEIALATTHLRPGGWLLVLAPAHKWLYTPFDVAIGHYRRYTKTDLKRLGAEPLDCIGLRYLDSAGLLASLANRFMLKSSMPSGRQIAFWDRVMVPFSRLIDPIIGYSVGKSVLGIWRKNGVQV